jgi:hypothetical protein
LVIAINHEVNTSTLIDILSPYPALLNGAALLAIPLLGPIETTEPGLRRLQNEITNKGELELPRLLAIVVSWMKSRDKADLFNLPVEWRNATEALLHSWVNGVLRTDTHVLPTSPPRKRERSNDTAIPEIGSTGSR